MQLSIKKVHPSAVIPQYATDGAACFDLHAVADHEVLCGTSSLIGTGLAVEVPPGWVLMMYSRSGHGVNHGVRLANGTGIIDSDYRGEIGVALHNDRVRPFRVFAGDRIAQAVLVQAPRVTLVEVYELTPTTRGSGGFGSTGSK